MRNYIFKNWKELGLSSEPNVGDNGVHGSASPLEALAEKVNWVGDKVTEDALGKALLSEGLTE
jgi:hypothetical protein